MTASYLEELKRFFVGRKLTATEDFTRLAGEISSGKKPAPEVIESALQRSGKSWDDLAEEIQRHDKRREAQAAIAAAVGIKKKRADLVDRIQEEEKAITAEITAIEQKYLAKRRGQEEELRQVDAIEQAAIKGRETLLQTSPPETIEKYHELLRKQGQVNGRLRYIESHGRTWTEADERAHDKNSTKSRDQRANILAEMRANKSEYEGLTTELAELNRAIQQLESEMLSA
jgi:hypothetical protein